MSLPNISSLEIPESGIALPEDTRIHKTFAWDFNTGDFALIDGKLQAITGIEYIKTWAEKCLRTVKNSLIYANSNYGSEHQSILGAVYDKEFVHAEIERMSKEALSVNNAIESVTNLSIETEGAKALVTIILNTIYGEVTISG